MNPYYRSLLKELEQMIQEGKYQEVFNLAKEELELPYVPLDAMHSLEKIEQE